MKYYNIAAAVCAAIGIILVFVGWDKDLSSITENIKVYGIYMKVGQDNE